MLVYQRVFSIKVALHQSLSGGDTVVLRSIPIHPHILMTRTFLKMGHPQVTKSPWLEKY
jgi:hypothetical protein